MAKRSLCMLLALATLFSLAVPAFAEEEPIATEVPAPVEYTVIFKLTVDGVRREPIDKIFASGALVELPEEVKALEQAGCIWTWYLDEELTKEMDLEGGLVRLRRVWYDVLHGERRRDADRKVGRL